MKKILSWNNFIEIKVALTMLYFSGRVSTRVEQKIGTKQALWQVEEW